MLGESKATSGFAVHDLNEAKGFYEGTLGLGVEVLNLEHATGSAPLRHL